MIDYLITAVSAVLFTEFVGYWIHRLLHSGKVAWLSESHMIHHEKLYPALGKMRTEKYLYPEHSRFGGVGLEWLIPISLVLAPSVVGAFVLGVPISTIIVFFAVSIAYAVIFLSYVHDGMHIKDFWLLNTVFGRWFKKARRLHDIHHLDMSKNFGISFYGLDRLFRTFQKKGLKYEME